MPLPLERLFLDISLIVIVATLLGLIARWLKQPLILGYVLAGFILGPAVLGFIDQTETIKVLSTFGIAFLLFLVGLELDLDKLKIIGRPSLLLGIGQVIFTALLGWLIIRLFGFNTLTASYIAVALTFSSTIIIVKMLSEKQALESLYGRLAVGMLLVQDFLAIFALVLLSGFASGQSPSTAELAFIFLKGAGLIMLSLIAGRYLLPPLFLKIAHSTELLLLSSIAWCFTLSLVAVVGGFSIEIGAFLAGLALARLPYHLEIGNRIKSLRDFFITIFFVVLGSQLALTTITTLAVPFIILSLFVLIGNPLIVMLIMRQMGYTKRTGFLVGLTVAQISEFSLILMNLGYTLGHVDKTAVALVTLVGITTITISSYLITYSDKLYNQLAAYLKWFEKTTVQERQFTYSELNDHIIIFGCDRLGEKLVKVISRLKLPLLVIDFDPETVRHLRTCGINCIYGDLGDNDIYQQANINKAKLIISTVPDLDDNKLLLSNVKQRQITSPVYVIANSWQETQSLYRAGADYVIFPHYLSSEHMAELIEQLFQNPDIIKQERQRQLANLREHYLFRHKA